MNKPHNIAHSVAYCAGRHLLTAAIALLIGMSITGCGSSKVTGKKNDTAGPIPGEVSLQTPQQRYTALCSGYTDWQDVSMPVQISLDAPASVSFSARAYMKRNQWIYLSVRLLGFELASVWVDNDSVHAIDKYHKRYLSESTSKIFAGAGISVGDIQDLLLGRGFMPGEQGGTFTTAMATALDFSATDDGLFILPAAKNTAFDYGFLLYPAANNILAASVSVGDTHAGVARYSGFTATPGGSFASTADLSIVKGRKASATVNWNFSSAKWNKGESRTWQTPRGYTRIDASSLLKSLTSL